jgi:hypothetical protein
MNIFAPILLFVTLVSTLSFTAKGSRLLSRKDVLCREPGMPCFMSAQNSPPLDASTKENERKVCEFLESGSVYERNQSLSSMVSDREYFR